MQPDITGGGRSLMGISENATVLGQVRSKLIVRRLVRSSERIVPVIDIHACEIHHRISCSPEQRIETLVKDHITGGGLGGLYKVGIGSRSTVLGDRALAVGRTSHFNPVVCCCRKAAEYVSGLFPAIIRRFCGCSPLPHLLGTGFIFVNTESISLCKICCKILEVAYAPAESNLAVIDPDFLLNNRIGLGCHIVGLQQFHLHIIEPSLLQCSYRSTYSDATPGR